MGITKSNGQKDILDKFYTKPKIATECLSFLKIEEYSLIIEPSAGNGSFSDLLPNCLAMDLEPENSKILKKDWFSYKTKRDHILVVGNPPYGQQNSFAIDFINHAAKFAQTIAFILPKSFKKESVKKRINGHYHVILEHDLPLNSFTYSGQDYSVSTVFQVWEYSENLRTNEEEYGTEGIEFVEKDNNPDLYIQRVGGRAGSFGVDWQDRSSSSNYFIKLKDSSRLKEFLQLLEKLKHPTKNYSVGPKSISRNELLKEIFENDSEHIFVSKVKQKRTLFD